jgi:hypothetical protein
VFKKLEEHKILTVIGFIVITAIVVPVIAEQVSPGILTKIAGSALKGKAVTKKVALPEKLDPPLLNKENLTGTKWEVTVQGFKVNVALEPDGKATASSDNMLVRQIAKSQLGSETISGSWDVDGAKLSVKTKVKDKEHSTDLVISGDKIYSKEGVPIVRKD